MRRARHRGAGRRHVIVFVEVKARSGGSFGTPFESVTWQKRQRLSQMAAVIFVSEQLTGVACRFDVVVSMIDQAGARGLDAFDGAFEGSRSR